MTNALKYAYPGSRRGELHVTVAETGSNEVSLTVSDNGVGLPGSFDLGRSKTLGLSIVDMLADQLNGRPVVQRQPGATFSLVF